MPERKNRQVDASEVQGDGAYVTLKGLSWGMQREMQRAMAAVGQPAQGEAASPEFVEANDQFTRKLLAECVVAWNWVDDDGAPLPLPGEEPGVIDRLTLDEVLFVVRHVSRPQVNAKN